MGLRHVYRLGVAFAFVAVGGGLWSCWDGIYGFDGGHSWFRWGGRSWFWWGIYDLGVGWLWYLGRKEFMILFVGGHMCEGV